MFCFSKVFEKKKTQLFKSREGSKSEEFGRSNRALASTGFILIPVPESFYEGLCL